MLLLHDHHNKGPCCSLSHSWLGYCIVTRHPLVLLSCSLPGSRFALLSQLNLTRDLSKSSQNLFCVCCLNLSAPFEVFLNHNLVHTQIPEWYHRGERIFVDSHPSPALLSLISHCVVVCHIQCTAMLQASAAFNHSIHMQDCFSGSSLACLLWLVNVCHFIAYSIWMFLMQCIFCLSSNVCEIVQ